MKTYACRTWTEGDAILFNPLDKKENALFRWINEDDSVLVERSPYSHTYKPTEYMLVPEELLW